MKMIDVDNIIKELDNCEFKDMIDNAQIEKEAKMEGKNLIMFLIPKQK